MTRTLVRTTTLLLLASACAPSPRAAPPQVAVEVPTAPAEAAPKVDPVIVSVSAIHAPQKVVVDGELGEWGSFPPPLPSSIWPPPGGAEPAETDGDAGKQEPPPNPAEASSHLALAVTNESVLIAAELGEPAHEGIWLGIGSQAPELPLLGEYVGRAGFNELDCERSINVDENQGYSWEPNPPEVKEACKALYDRYAAFKAGNDKRFARLFKIDREGVRGVSADGDLSPIAGAKSVWKPGPKGATAEIALPLEAMPRMAEAPLASLRLVARVVTSPKPPELAPGQWIWVKLPDAISFEPFGALRAYAVKRGSEVGNGQVGSTTYQQPRGLSYQPGDTLHVEVMDSPQCTTVVPRDLTLYQKQASVDDVEVGYVTTPVAGPYSCEAVSENSLAIFKKGKLVDIVALPGIPRGVVARDGELHVPAFPRWGTAWSVIAVAPDGSHHDVGMAKRVPIAESEGTGVDVSAFASDTLDSFGWRWVEHNRDVEVTWRWDTLSKTYTFKERILPPSKKAKKAKKAKK